VGHWLKRALPTVILLIFALSGAGAGCTNGHSSGYDILVITTSSLPDAAIGVAYEEVLTASRKNGPYDFSWSLDSGSGTLPDGLALSTGGLITGVPAKSGTYVFVVKVTDNAWDPPYVATRALHITVTGESAILIGTSPDPLPSAQVGFAYSATMTASGGVPTYTWTLDSGSPSLPSGLSLSSGGHFTGTPTQSGSYSFVIKVTDSTTPVGITTTKPITINVSTPGQVIITTASITKGQAGIAYSFLLSATGGTTPYTWSLASGALPSGLSLNFSTGEISGTTNESGIWNFTLMVTDSTPDSPGEYTKDFSLQIDPAFLLDITTTSPLVTGQADIAYVQILNATGGTEPYAFILDAGSLPTGLTLSSGGILSGIPEEPGNFSFVIKVTDSTTPTAKESVKGFVLNIDPPGSLTIEQESIPDAVQNNPYETVLSAIGGSTTYTWSITSGALPPGINLAADGVISGTAATYGDWSFVVQVTDGSLTNSRFLSLSVRPLLTITTTALNDALLGMAYSYTLSATGGLPSYTWSLDNGSSALPPGLSLSTGGHITGSASTQGSYSFALKVTDNNTPSLSTTKAFILNVRQIVITTKSLTGANWGQAGYSAVVKIEHVLTSPPVPVFQWTLKPGSGNLPPNLSLAPTGDPVTGYTSISGNVTSGSGTVTYTFTLVITETNSGEVDEQELSITVTSP